MSIFTLLAEAAEQVGAVGKDGTMSAGRTNYSYRKIDDVIEAVHPVFAELGIVMTPFVQVLEYDSMATNSGGSMRLCTMQVDFTFYGPEGDHLVVRTVGEATDSGDKAPNKAHTAAMKVALCQLLLIPFDSQDPDDTPSEAAPSRPQSASRDQESRSRPPAPEPAEKPSCTECGEEFQRGERKTGRRGEFRHVECPSTAAVAEAFPGAEPVAAPPDYNDEPF